MKKNTWKENYENVVKILQNVEKRTVTSINDKRLKQWLSLQITIIRNGIKDENGNYLYKNFILTKENIEKLNNANFIWDNKEYKFLKSKIDKNYKKRKLELLRKRFIMYLDSLEKKEFETKEDINKINDEFYDSLGVNTPFETTNSYVLRKRG